MSGSALSAGPPRSRIAYPVLLAAGAVDAAGYSVIAPVLPELGETTGAGPAVLGLLVGTFSLAMLAGFPLAGLLARRTGSRLLLAVALAVVALGSAGMVAGDGLATLFAARAVMGLGAGGVWLGVALGTLERWPGEEYVCMSRVLAAYSVGGVLGLALGALGGTRSPFVAYLILVVLALPAVLLLGEPRRAPRARWERAALRAPGFPLAAALILFTWVGFGVVEGVLPLHLAGELGQAGIAAVLVGTALVVAAASTVAGRLEPLAAAAVGVPLAVAGIALAGAVEGVALWSLALLLAGAGLGAGNTGSTGILLETVGRERIVLPMVVWSQVGILGYLLGPALGGAVADALGYAGVGLVPLVFAAAAAAAVLGRARLRSEWSGHPGGGGGG